MNQFEYRGGRLHAEDVDLVRLALEVGTPVYVYSTAALELRYRSFARSLPLGAMIAYSVKANGNLAVLRTLARLGAGADVVSAGELKKALAAGIPATRIVFSGVGKTKREMKLALEIGIHQFNVESEAELEALADVADAMGMRAPIAIRVNPDIDARTHAKITTGTAETKFGIPWRSAREVYARAAELPRIDAVGVDVHIGSQVTDPEPFEQTFERAVALVAALREDGHRIRRLDLGGGLGVAYRPNEPQPFDSKSYGDIIARCTRGLDVELILEPGRAIAADAGILLTRAIYVKDGERKKFLIVDAGMNDLLRPALYDAYHEIVPVTEQTRDAATACYDVVGPICETADLFARDRKLPEIRSGDLLAFMTAGAYGAAMSSAYNARAPAPEVLVNGDAWSVVKPRMSDESLVGQDRIPSWLEG